MFSAVKSAVLDYLQRILDRRPDLNCSVDHVFAGVDGVALEYRFAHGEVACGATGIAEGGGSAKGVATPPSLSYAGGCNDRQDSAPAARAWGNPRPGRVSPAEPARGKSRLPKPLNTRFAGVECA